MTGRDCLIILLLCSTNAIHSKNLAPIVARSVTALVRYVKAPSHPQISHERFRTKRDTAIQRAEKNYHNRRVQLQTLDDPHADVALSNARQKRDQEVKAAHDAYFSALFQAGSPE